MTLIQREEVEARLFMNGNLVFPDTIRSAIISCLKTNPSEIDEAKSYLSSAYKGDYCSKPDVRYESDATIDAYTLDYLPRNFFVPRIAIRDLSLSPRASRFDAVIRILDVGSGTGAVALGVLELFSQSPLKRYKIHFQALDSSKKALQRQKEIIEASGLHFKGDEYKRKLIDLSDTIEVDKVLSSTGKWDLIISANFMVELDDPIQTALLKVLTKHLSENGSIIIAEPAQDRGKIVISNAAKLSRSQSQGLSIYYPCHDSCRKPMCWSWRQYQVGYINPHVMGKNGIITFSDKSLIIAMLILNKHGATIFDEFRKKSPNLNWGVVAPRKNDYEACHLGLTAGKGKSYNRGSIVGWEKDSSVITEYFQL